MAEFQEDVMADEKDTNTLVPPPPTKEQLERLANRLDLPGMVIDLVDDNLARKLREEIMHRLGIIDMQEVCLSYRDALISVPELPASDLIKQAEEELKVTHHNPILASWDFIRDEAGKRYKAKRHRFKRDVSTEEVLIFFENQGYKGNAPAFVVWVATHKPDGYHASIPRHARLWRSPKSGKLYAPYFDKGDTHREFGVQRTDIGWSDVCTFVGFQETK